MARRDITSEVVPRQISHIKYLLLWCGSPIGHCLQYGAKFEFRDKRFSSESKKEIMGGRTVRIFFDGEAEA